MLQKLAYDNYGESIMNISFEKRRHHRLSAALQLLYGQDHQNDGAKMNKGLTENISISGLYFICMECQELDLACNQVISLTIKVPSQHAEIYWSNLLKAEAQILRVDPLPGRPQARGVALKFIEDLRFVKS
jgi:hypothetical protein